MLFRSRDKLGRRKLFMWTLRVSQYVLRNAPCPVLTVPEISTDS